MVEWSLEEEGHHQSTGKSNRQHGPPGDCRSPYEVTSSHGASYNLVGCAIKGGGRTKLKLEEKEEEEEERETKSEMAASLYREGGENFPKTYTYTTHKSTPNNPTLNKSKTHGCPQYPQKLCTPEPNSYTSQIRTHNLSPTKFLY